MSVQRSRRSAPRRGSLRGRERPVPRRSRFREELDPVRRGMLLAIGLLTCIILGVAANFFFSDDTSTDAAGKKIGTAPSVRERPAGRQAPVPSGREQAAPAQRPQTSQAPLPPVEKRTEPPLGGTGTSRSGGADTQTSLWGYPFVGYGLDEIGRELSARYAGKAPRSWGENLSGVVSRLEPVPDAAGPVVALTLDACTGKGDAGYDAGLIEFLRARRIPATLFVTSLWAKANPRTLQELAADPLFEIGAHGARHKPASVNGREAYGIKGTASIADLVDEVEGNARELQRATGKRPRWFRSGTAFYDDVAVKVIGDLGLHIAGYSIAADEGASLPADDVADKAEDAENGDIILAHMNHPESGTREGLIQALTRMQKEGYVFIRLSDARK